MRILYITSGGPGGISSHVRCLTQCLKGIAETAVCIVDRDEVLWRMLEEDGTPYYRCECSTGHDPALFFKVRHSVRDFRPDIIHLHGIQFLSALYLRLFTRIPRVCSIHTPSSGKPRWDRDILNRLVLPCYFLPVSTPTWDGFRAAYPKARGEVFFNPIRVESNNPPISNQTIPQSQIQQSNNFIVGMVGRNADQKDWPSFHKVEELVKRRFSDCLSGGLLDLRLLDCLIGGMGASNNQTISNQTISRRSLAERKVDEWLRGVTRESFAAALETLVEEKAATGEYRFKRDLEKELALEGAKRFFDEFSRKIIGLSDGRCVYFAPDARSRNRNGNDLSRCWAEYAFHAVSNGGAKLIGKDYHERWYNSYKNANMGLIEPVLLDEQCVPVLKRNCAADAIKFFGKTHDHGNFDVVTRLDECGSARANMTEVTFEASTKKIKSPRLVPLAEAIQTVVSHQTTAGSYPSDRRNISNPSAVDNPPRANQSDNPTSSNPTISSVEFLNAGEKGLCNGREAIARMDLFVMTSKHEQLPTTVLECFALGTPICGFIPVGGTSDILGFSKGPVREAFIAERNCEKLADIVMDLMAHPEKRQALVEDGRQILENHFDAEKNCRGQLMRVYEKCLIV